MISMMPIIFPFFRLRTQSFGYFAYANFIYYTALPRDLLPWFYTNTNFDELFSIDPLAF